MKEISEKSKRLRYVRLLEKFLTRTISLIKNGDMPFYNFIENINRYYEDIKKVEATRLDSEYLKKLETFVNLTLQKVDTIEHNEYEELKELLLKEANLLDKEKNKTNYKKDKHKYQSYNDGY